jgi:hypothetical protein
VLEAGEAQVCIPSATFQPTPFTNAPTAKFLRLSSQAVPKLASLDWLKVVESVKIFANLQTS